MNLGNFVLFNQFPYVENELIPASSITSTEKQKSFEEQYQVKVPLYADVVTVAHNHEVNPEYIFITPKHQDLFCYYDFPVFIPISIFEDSYLSFLQLKQRVERNTNIFKRALKEKDIAKILALSDDNVKIMLLNKLYWELPHEERYEVWVEVYQLLDYGHSLMDKGMVEDAISKQPQSYRENVLSMLNGIANEDVLAVYRGVGSVSTEPSVAMSWTTSLSIASYFASRYDDNGKVYQATIKKEHIIDYLMNRHEEEILLNPQHLMELKEYPMISFRGELQMLSREGYLDEYFLYRNTFMKEKDYRHPDGIHGIPHVKRVLYHCLAMAKQLDLNSSERAILSNSAVYHDIGRKHDGYCLEHGVWSWKKLKRKMENESSSSLIEVNFVEPFKKGSKEYELRALTKEEENIVRFIIEYHCRSDKDGKKKLDKLPIKDKDTAWKLYEIFKDCDGLDRIRLSKTDLDVSYLRTEIATKRVLIAHDLPKLKQL